MKRIVNLEKEIEKLVQEIEKKKTQNEEITFALNGVSMEKESEKEYYEAAIQEHLNVIARLEKSLEHLHVKLSKLDSTANQLETELGEISQQLEETKKVLEIERKSGRERETEVQTLNKFLD